MRQWLIANVHLLLPQPFACAVNVPVVKDVNGPGFKGSLVPNSCVLVILQKQYSTFTSKQLKALVDRVPEDKRKVVVISDPSVLDALRALRVTQPDSTYVKATSVKTLQPAFLNGTGTFSGSVGRLLASKMKTLSREFTANAKPLNAFNIPFNHPAQAQAAAQYCWPIGVAFPSNLLNATVSHLGSDRPYIGALHALIKFHALARHTCIFLVCLGKMPAALHPVL